MKVQHAVFGPRGGHAFLGGSDASLENAFRNAAWVTDLPQTAPPGVIWRSFFRLVLVDEYLVLVHTQPLDGGPRAGMVLSRAALIPSVDAPRLNDLRPLAKVLLEPWVEGIVLEPLEVSETFADGDSSHPSKLAVQIATALSQDSPKPLVVSGQDGFDDAMFELWAHVPPELRAQLTFSLSFGPQDAHTTAILCTPEALAGQWDDRHRVDQLAQQPVSRHTAVLLGLSGGEHVRSFARDIGFVLNSPATIALALMAHQLWKGGMDAADALRLVRILSGKATAPKAAEIKAAALSRLVAFADQWTAPDALAMRNVDATGFTNADELARGLRGWVSDIVRRANPAEVVTFLQSWADERTNPLWVAAVGDGLRSAFEAASGDDVLYSAMWTALTLLSTQAGMLLNLLTSADAPERGLLNSLPEGLDAVAVDRLVDEFAGRKWWELAGESLAATRAPLEALTKALSLQGKGPGTRVVATALGRATDQEVAEAALATADPVALELASAACARTPAVLHDFDWRDPLWYTILGVALDADAGLVTALPNPVAGIASVLQAGVRDADIWAIVARTPLGDLTAVPGRSLAWAVIPAPHRATVLAATTKGWLTSFEAGERVLTELEPELEVAVRREVSSLGFLAKVLSRSPSAFSLYLRDFDIASESAATLLLSELDQSRTHLSESSARELGRLIYDRHWADAAKQAARMMNVRDDFRPLVAECFSILGTIDRMWTGYKLNREVHLSDDEAWEAFETEATTMYEWGPEDRELWSRAGGRNKDLPRDGTGREKWHRCVRELRAGKPPGVHAVLRAMQAEYSWNDTLKVLLRHRFGK